MKKIRIDKHNKMKALLYLLACFLILDGNSVYHSLVYRDLNLQFICIGIVAFIAFYATGRKIRVSFFIKIVLIFFYFFAYYVLKFDDVNQSVYFCVLTGVPLFLILFSSLKQLQMEFELFYCIEKIVLLLSAASLFFWFFGEVLGLIHTNMSVIVAWGKIKVYQGYYGLQFRTIYSNSLGAGLPINSGIFTEGPMFCLWLCISLATECFLRDRMSKAKTVLLVTTILSTLSTTGIFFISACVAMKYIGYINGKVNTWKIWLTIFLIMLLPVTIDALQQVYMLKVSTSSYSIRLQDYIAGYLLWKDNPIFGSGYGNITALQKYTLASKAGNVGFSNSISAILGTGGLWNFVVYIISIMGPIIRCNGEYAREKGFFIAYMFLTVFLIFNSRVIMVVFLAFSLYTINDIKNERIIKFQNI